MRKIFLLIAFNFSVVKINAQQSIPYFTDFETQDTAWNAVTNAGSSWQWGIPTSGFPASTFSGTHCWGVGLDSAYWNNTNAALYSPFFTFTNVVHSRLSFKKTLNTEYSWDAARIDYTSDNGATWNVLGTNSILPQVAPQNCLSWYFNSNILSSGFPGWCGHLNYWSYSEQDISFLAGQNSVQFRFIFTSDASISQKGFAHEKSSQ